MAEPKEPKKETVRIKLPPRPGGSGNSNSANRDTVRINLPPRAPNNFAGNSVTPKPPSAPVSSGAQAPTLPGLGQSPKPPSFPVPSIAEPPSSAHSPSVSEEVMEPAHPLASGATTSPGPKKETARIVTMPDPPRSATPTVKMSKTQPLITAPEASPQTAPIFIEPASAQDMIESIPVPLCWALVGISALLFIIQLWTYFS